MHPGELPRTWTDRFISAKNAVKYAVMDRINLTNARRLAEPDDGSVTVIIPTRNRWDLLIDRALPSITFQTVCPKVIIVNDGGDEPTSRQRQLIYEMTGGGVILLGHKKNQHYPDTPFYHWLVGPSDAMNLALRYVDTAWVARIDDDDRYDHHYALEMLRTHARKMDAEFVSADWIGPDNKISEPYDEGDVLVGGVQTWLYRDYLACFKYNLDSWRKSWDRNNEIDLYKRMLRAGVRFSYLPQVVTHILPRPGVSQIGLKGYLEEHGVSR